MHNTPCPSPNQHLDIERLRDAIGPGLQIGVGDAVLRLISEPAVCKD